MGEGLDKGRKKEFDTLNFLHRIQRTCSEYHIRLLGTVAPLWSLVFCIIVAGFITSCVDSPQVLGVSYTLPFG